jgi:hypothetical protein
VDNERTAVVRGAGAWGTINVAYRRYATVLRFHGTRRAGRTVISA